LGWLFGLFLALVCPEIIVLGFMKGQPHLWTPELLLWGLTIALLFYVVVVEKRPLVSIGLRLPNWRTVTWGICSGLAILLGIVQIYGVVFRLLNLTINMQAMAALPRLPFAAQLLLVVRAAFFEEIAYRGYAIEPLTELTGSRMSAAVICVGSVHRGLPELLGLGPADRGGLRRAGADSALPVEAGSALQHAGALPDRWSRIPVSLSTIPFDSSPMGSWGRREPVSELRNEPHSQLT